MDGRHGPERRIEAYAEIGQDGGVLLFSFDPPGLLARGTSLGAAVREAAERGWPELRAMAAAAGRSLEAAGKRSPWPTGATPPAAPGGEQTEVAIIETRERRGAVANGNTSATFRLDLAPLTPADVTASLELLAESRRHLLALRPLLECSPDPAAMLAFRSRPDRKSIAEQLMHIAAVERWYLVRIRPELPRLPVSAGPWERLAAVRGLVVRTLAGMGEHDLAIRTRVNGEVWTPRKVIRRLMYHERFHRDTIARDMRLARLARQ